MVVELPLRLTYVDVAKHPPPQPAASPCWALSRGGGHGSSPSDWPSLAAPLRRPATAAGGRWGVARSPECRGGVFMCLPCDVCACVLSCMCVCTYVCSHMCCAVLCMCLYACDVCARGYGVVDDGK